MGSTDIILSHVVPSLRWVTAAGFGWMQCLTYVYTWSNLIGPIGIIDIQAESTYRCPCTITLDIYLQAVMDGLHPQSHSLGTRVRVHEMASVDITSPTCLSLH